MNNNVNAIKLSWRSAAALTLVCVVAVIAFAWPLLAPGAVRDATAAGGLAHSTDAPWLFVALLPLLLAVVLAEVGDGGMDAKAVAMLGMLAACGAALRPIGGGETGFDLVFFLLLPAGRVLGRGFGFVLGALTMFVSALLTSGVGPWLPFQMIGAAWVGFGAGCLPRCRGRSELLWLAAYGALAGLAYGLLLNLWFWPFSTNYPHAISFVPGAPLTTNLAHWLRFDATTSLGFDIPRALANTLLVLLAGRPVLAALRRAARRAAFDAVPQFGG